MDQRATAVPSRRAEYAEATRHAIVVAARELFAQRGYAATRVDDIAASARVSPATVYAVAGGKQGLLRTLVDIWSQAPIVEETYRAVSSAETAEDVLRITASSVRQMREEWGDVMKIVINTAPMDEAAAAGLRLATERYRAGTDLVARRLADLGALKPEMSTEDASDILWFYFGYSGFFTLMDDNGWSLDRAEHWLRDMAATAILDS